MTENNEKYYEKISEDFCGICYEQFEDVIKSQVYCLKCPNKYHVHCMKNWKSKSATPKKKMSLLSKKNIKISKIS